MRYHISPETRDQFKNCTGKINFTAHCNRSLLLFHVKTNSKFKYSARNVLYELSVAVSLQFLLSSVRYPSKDSDASRFRSCDIRYTNNLPMEIVSDDFRVNITLKLTEAEL